MKKFKLKKSAKNSIRYLICDSGRDPIETLASDSVNGSVICSIIRSVSDLIWDSIWDSVRHSIYNDLRVKLKRKKK
jgi:hypothetical protein